MKVWLSSHEACIPKNLHLLKDSGALVHDWWILMGTFWIRIANWPLGSWKTLLSGPSEGAD
jgi:hypothetical protein